MKVREQECRAELEVVDNCNEEKPIYFQIKDNKNVAIIALTEAQATNVVDEIIFILGGRKT